MARDGSGTYNLPQAAFVSGTTIESAKVNSDFSDIASALTQSIAKDGQTPYTASQPMGGFKLTGLGVGTGTGQSARYDELNYTARGHLSGLQCTSRTNTTVVISAGTWTEDGNTATFSNISATINCANVGALGLDTGSLANSTWYHAFAIAKTDGTTSLLASTSVSSPTFPTGYTLKRRLFSFKTNGSAQIIDFIQNGDNFRWVTPVGDVNLIPGVTTAVTRTLTVPTGVIVFPLLTTQVTASGASGVANLLTSLDETDTAITQGTVMSQTVVSTNGPGIAVDNLHTNTSAQIRSRISTADGQLYITTYGWRDTRGRDA